MRRNVALIFILLVAVGVRTAYLAAHQSPSDATTAIGELARNIVAGRWFVVNDKAMGLIKSLSAQEHRLVQPAEVNYAAVDAHPQLQPYTTVPIGPPLLLAALWKLTGDERYIYGQLLQIAVDTLIVLLVYRIALLLFRRRRTALIAAALYAVFPPIAQQTTYFSPDIWSVDFSIAIVATYLEALHSSRRWAPLILCGLVVGIGAFFRPNVILLPAVLALACIPWTGWRRQLRSAALATGVAVLVLVPWTVYNYNKFHTFIAVRTGLGVTLMVGLGELHNNFGAVESESTIRAGVHRVRPDLVYSTPAYDAYLLHRAIHLIEDHQLYYAKLVARRVLLSSIGEYEYMWMYRGGESPLRYEARTGRGILSYAIERPFYFLQSALQPAIFLLAMLALALTWRGRRREHVLLIVFVLATLIPYWLTHVETRYVLPTVLAYLIWIALGVDLLAVRLARRLRARGVARVPQREPAAQTR